MRRRLRVWRARYRLFMFDTFYAFHPEFLKLAGELGWRRWAKERARLVADLSAAITPESR